MNSQNEEESQKYAVEACLVAARQLADDGKPEQAEQLFKKALITAESKTGEKGALAGLVLIDLWQFYQQQGREEEAEPIWRRVRAVMLEYVECYPELLERIERNGGKSTPKVAGDGGLSAVLLKETE